uniref:Uncharacterized protein n=1 Tax=Anguilla anguilla TaxID=7936 RepID=A0A0E9V990_ANGAN
MLRPNLLKVKKNSPNCYFYNCLKCSIRTFLHCIKRDES